jgi:hypothetical protein
MTIDEALAKVTDQEAKAFLQKVISDQNGYVTKLEAQIADFKKAPAQPQAQGTDDITRKYLEDNMKRDITNQAVAIIKANYGDAIVEACMKDYLEFLKANMTLKNTTVEYATDAFNLVYGRCYAKKDHPVHNVGKATAPSGTPTPQVQAGNNAAGVQQVASIINGQPPVMNPNDQSAGQGLPGTQGTPVKNTRDAFAAFKDRLRQGGSQKFQ